MKNELLVQAIAQRRLVTLQYGGKTRTVEPHKYGVDEAGEEKLLCWQTDGGSKSGKHAGWKVLIACDIRATTMTEEVFAGARADYKPEWLPMHHIYARL